MNLRPYVTEAIEIVRNARRAAWFGLITWDQAREVILNTLAFVAARVRQEG